MSIAPISPRWQLLSLASMLLVAGCATTTEEQVLALTKCPSVEAAFSEMNELGTLVVQLTRDQTKEAADSKYKIAMKGLERGWTREQEQAFISKFLNSSEYKLSQAQRKPYQTTLANIQATWRQRTESEKVANLCRFAKEGREAVVHLYALNRGEIALLEAMLESE